MESETKEKFRKELFKLRFQQMLYRTEHKDSNINLDNQIKTLKKEYSKKIVKERIGEIKK